MDRTITMRTAKHQHVTAEHATSAVRTVRIECPLTKKEAAQVLGVSVDTLDQWTAKYGIPHIKYDMDGNRGNRGKVLYLASDLLAFRDKFRVEGRDTRGEVSKMIRDATD